MYTLRPYQADAVRETERSFESGIQHVLIVLPTASGKTIIMSEIAADAVNHGQNVMVLAHQKELLKQCADKMEKANGLSTQIKGMPTPRSVYINSVQGMSREGTLQTFDPGCFDLIIVDECHHIMSKSYQKIFDYFKTARAFGVTATPDRADHKNLGQFFDRKAYEYSIKDAVRDGYLARPVAQMIPLQIDISDVKIQNGDYAPGMSGERISEYFEQIAEEMKRYCRGRKTVVFLPLVKIAKEFRDVLNRHGFHAAEVDGMSSNRDEILKDFDSGKYNAICNSMLLTEGWDCPSADCVVVLRPTKSRALYQQMVGRILRTCEGKKDALILDFLWLTGKHPLVHPSSLVSKSEDLDKRIQDRIESSDVQVDILSAEAQAERDAVEEREKALAKTLEKQSNKKRKAVDPLEFASSAMEEAVMFYEPACAWEMEPPTEKQVKMLEQNGIDPEAVTTRGLASAIIDSIIRRSSNDLASPKQLRQLKKYDMPFAEEWTKKEASVFISRIAANHWSMKYSAISYVPDRLKEKYGAWINV